MENKKLIVTDLDGTALQSWESLDPKTKEALITNKRHYILKSPHPSPLSASYGFFGNGHFKKINEILIEEKKDPIDWTL